MIRFAQRALGACLVGVPEEALHVWYGSGDNGKSTLLDVIRFVLGDYGVTMPQGFLAQRAFDNIPTDLMDLRGARFAASHEPDQRMVLDEAKVKYLTGRDRMKARRLYHDWVEFDPTHTMVLVTNHKPVVKTQTRATWRRIKLWPFEYIVPAELKDTTLPEKLRAEASGVLNWLLTGCTEWVAAGRQCDPPGRVQDATAEYQQSEDTLAEWFDKCIVTGPQEAAGRDLGTSYADWARCNNIVKPFSPRKIGTLLEERGFRYRMLHGVKVFQGLGLRTTFKVEKGGD